MEKQDKQNLWTFLVKTKPDHWVVVEDLKASESSVFTLYLKTLGLVFLKTGVKLSLSKTNYHKAPHSSYHLFHGCTLKVTVRISFERNVIILGLVQFIVETYKNSL